MIWGASTYMPLSNLLVNIASTGGVDSLIITKVEIVLAWNDIEFVSAQVLDYLLRLSGL